MKLLELFCGTKSISNVFRDRGHEVFTVDTDTNFKPCAKLDVMVMSLRDVPFKPDVIWASPPCTHFSVSAISKNFDEGRPKRDETINSMLLVCKTIMLIKALNPRIWFIENPRGMLRKQWFMQGLDRKTVTYCQYGDFRQKPTDIWTNLHLWTPRPPCKPGDKCHDAQPRTYERKLAVGAIGHGTQGMKNATERGTIPQELCLEICKACESMLSCEHPSSEAKEGKA